MIASGLRGLTSTVLLLPLLVGAACSGSGSGGSSSGTLSIEACTLGCSTFAGQVGCGLNGIFINEEIVVEFSGAVNLNSVTKDSFRVQDLQTGASPVGTFLLDPSNPRRLIFRPQLTFDSSGNPIFGFEDGASYQIVIPGASTDPPPYVRSTGGQPLATRLQCTVTATQGVNDPVPGKPRAEVFVDVVMTDAMGDPILDPNGDPILIEDSPADGAVNVFQKSQITLEFNDIMNPATLVNPVTGKSNTLRIFIDADGDLNTTTDRVEVFGTFVLSVNQASLTTRVIFTPSVGFPSAGSGPTKRLVILDLNLFPNSIVDLGGNSLGGDTDAAFTPQVIQFSEVTLPREGGEDFAVTSQQDMRASGAVWGAETSEDSNENGMLDPGEDKNGNGVLDTGFMLAPGPGGGSGRLGALLLNAGEVLTLYTDGMRPKVDPADPTTYLPGEFRPQLFGPAALVHNLGMDDLELAMPSPSSGLNDSQNITSTLLENYDPMMGLPGTTTEQVLDGIFEFESVVLRSGSILRFVGDLPPRIYARGDFIIQGRIDVGAGNAPDHDSTLYDGGVPGVGGPAGADGGKGGLRPDPEMAIVDLLDPMGNVGLDNPLDPTLADVDGQPGEGIPVEDPLNPGMFNEFAGGPAGVRWPEVFPSTIFDLGTITTNLGCFVDSVGGIGGGGGYAISPDPVTTLPLSADDIMCGGVTTPPPTPGGDVAPLGLSNIRSLSPEEGYLRGGSGGGGAGGHWAFSSGAGFFCNCGSLGQLNLHSGCGGGGGGGAFQGQAGNRIIVDGVIDAGGGDGGSSLTGSQLPFSELAQPGGGGSGGALLLQSLGVTLNSLPGRLDVGGGLGGVGFPGGDEMPSIAGDGSPGLVRVESGSPTLGGEVDPAVAANSINPCDEFASPCSEILSSDSWSFFPVGDFPGIDYQPGAISAGQSCWILPSGNFFLVEYDEDDPMAGTLGWNMTVLQDDGAGGLDSRAYRGEPGSLEDLYPLNELQTKADMGLDIHLLRAPIIVRFQGARAIDAIDDLCNVQLTGANAPIQQGSLTPWMLHPAELNTYWDAVFPMNPEEVSKRQPNMIRYQVVFNRKHFAFPTIRGITDLFITATPD